MAETTGTNERPPFDLQGLNETYGEDTVAELLVMSVDESRGLLSDIARGISQKDGKKVMEAAHQLKGLAATMTINGLASLSLQLETLARQEQWDKMPEKEQLLRDEFAQVEKYIQSVLGGTQA